MDLRSAPSRWSSRSTTPTSPAPGSQGSDLVGPHRLRGLGGHRRRHLHDHRVHVGNITGPAISISFIIAAIACGLAALCYAEFASTVPVAGSAYTFSYATFGEFLAWIIGWDLILEFAVGAAVVSKGWSSYLGTVFGFSGGTVDLGPLNFDWGALLIVAVADHAAGAGHQVVVERQRGDHRDQGGRGPARHRRRCLLHQGRELLALHPARGAGATGGPASSSRVFSLITGAGSSTTGGTDVGGRIDRVLRVHRVRRGRDHRRGDQEPPARRAARHPGHAGDRHRPLRAVSVVLSGMVRYTRAQGRDAGGHANLATAFGLNGVTGRLRSSPSARWPD